MTKDLEALINIITSKTLTEERKVEQIQAILSENLELVNAANNNGETPLLIASHGGHLEVVEALLAIKGIDVNAADNHGWTPLFVATCIGNLEIVQLLLAEEEINANLVNNYGETPLLAASQNGHLEIVKELLKHNPDVNAADDYGWTPLLIASQRGHLEIVKELLKHNSDVNAVEKDGWTALRCVVQNGWSDPNYDDLKIIKVLLGCSNIDVNIADNVGDTSLLAAVNNGHLEIVQLLLAKEETNVNHANNHGWTPLLVAINNGHLEIVQLLLAKKEINANLARNDGKTPLLTAIEEGHENVAEFLIQHILTQDHKADKPDYLTEKYSTYWDKCITEIEEMKEYTLGNMSKRKVSLYDFFAENDLNQLASYMSNKDIVETLDTNGYKEKFLIYAIKVEEQYKEGMERNCVLNSAKNYFSNARLSSTIPVIREKFDEYIFQEIFKYADNALLKEILPHRDELASVEGTRNSSAPQLSVEDNKTVSSRFSDIRLEEHGKSVTQQNKT